MTSISLKGMVLILEDLVILVALSGDEDVIALPGEGQGLPDGLPAGRG